MKKIVIVMLGFMLVLAGCGNTKSSTGTSTSNTSADNSNTSTKKVTEVKIGGLYPLSGGLASEGKQMFDAAQMAVDEVNAAGGIKSLGGAKVVLEKADSEGKPEKGVSEVQRLDRDGVLGILGTYTSGVALPATQEAERAKVPFVIDIASADQITERGFKYTFRLQPPAKLMASNFLNYIDMLNSKSDTKLKTVVLAHENSIFGSSIADMIKKNADSHGLQVLADLPHPASTADLSSTINKIKSLNPDIIISTTYLRDGTMLVKGLHEAKFKAKAIIGVANGAFSNEAFMKDEKDINQYIMDVNYTINPQSDLAIQVEKKYKEQFNKNLSPNAAYSYTAAKVLIDAIERAGSTDRSAIRDALTKTNYTNHILPQGAIKFDDKGQNVNAQAVLNQIFDGQSKVVYPDEYKNADPVYPMP